MKALLQRLTLIALLLGSFQSAFARDDLQAYQWLSLNLWQQNPHKLHFYADNRFIDDASEQWLWLASLRYKYAAHKNLQLGLGYTYLDVRNIAADTWTHQDRLEFEFSPKAKLSDTLSFHFRNRLEVRYIEDVANPSYRTRHRIQLTKSLQSERITKLYANTEWFYLYDKGRDLFNEVRTVPLGVGFKLTESASIDLFYMIRTTRPNRDTEWSHAHALGTHLIYTF